MLPKYSQVKSNIGRDGTEWGSNLYVGGEMGHNKEDETKHNLLSTYVD